MEKDWKKKYQDALRIVKGLRDDWASTQNCAAKDIENAFPELKRERENKLMRDMAIEAVRSPEAQLRIKSWDVEPDDVIAWIEKQAAATDMQQYKDYDCFRVNLSKFHPVIREFCDMLEDKPKPYWDGWYEAMDWVLKNGNPFDRKTKQNPNDEMMRKVAMSACEYMIDNFENSTKQYEDAYKWLKDVVVTRSKQVWTDADDKATENILHALSACESEWSSDMSGEKNWIRNLKDRCTSIPNGWNESDYLEFDAILSIVKEWEWQQSQEEKDYYGDDVHSGWLKSFRPDILKDAVLTEIDNLDAANMFSTEDAEDYRCGFTDALMKIRDYVNSVSKLKFRIGQTVVPKNRQENELTITSIRNGHYYSEDLDICPIAEQDNWELFKINKL